MSAGALNLTGAVFADDPIAGPINIMAGAMYLAEDGAGFGGSDGPLGGFSVKAANFEQGLAAAYQTTTANLMHRATSSSPTRASSGRSTSISRATSMSRTRKSTPQCG